VSNIRGIIGLDKSTTDEQVVARVIELRKMQIVQVLARHGLTECSECGSWIFHTGLSKAFHARRCSS
jgi:hypothetical protein